MNAQLNPIAVLGAGAFGTALALYLARQGQQVRLWSIEKSEIESLLADQENKRFLPGFRFPAELKPCYHLDEAVADTEDVIIAVPSIGYRNVLTLVKPFLAHKPRLISATKGIDAQSDVFLNELIIAILGNDYPYAVLSGPTFAREVAQGLPSAVVIATHYQKLLLPLMKRFDSTYLRTYPSDDVIGVEVGGVLKNVIAIAAGLSDGMGFAANTRSALITLGLAEISRFGQALGGKKETFMGLAGMGDLILTCGDNQSRNRRFGYALGQGKDVRQTEAEIGQAIEGKQNTEQVMRLAKKQDLSMPICETVQAILQGILSCKEPLKVMDRLFRGKF